MIRGHCKVNELNFARGPLKLRTSICFCTHFQATSNVTSNKELSAKLDLIRSKVFFRSCPKNKQLRDVAASIWVHNWGPHKSVWTKRAFCITHFLVLKKSDDSWFFQHMSMWAELNIVGIAWRCPLKTLGIKNLHFRGYLSNITYTKSKVVKIDIFSWKNSCRCQTWVTQL